MHPVGGSRVSSSAIPQVPCSGGFRAHLQQAVPGPVDTSRSAPMIRPAQPELGSRVPPNLVRP